MEPVARAVAIGTSIMIFLTCLVGALTGQAAVHRKDQTQLAQGYDAPAKPRQMDAALIRVVVRSLLNDPDSAVFGPIREGYDGAWCGSVNAKNAFGGYVGARRFVIAHKPLALFVQETDPRFPELWRRVCQ